MILESKLKVSTIITARGGSKSIPKKNIIDINGIPLLAFPINASLNSKFISNTYVDTDCDQIANIALEYGAKIIKRPEYLAGDTVDHGEVIRYSCNEVLKKEKVDIFLSPYIDPPFLPGIKVIATIHDLIFLKFDCYFNNFRKIKRFLSEFRILITLIYSNVFIGSANQFLSFLGGVLFSESIKFTY